MDNNALNITATETAAKKMKLLLQNRGKGIGVRIGVRTSGCSGMAYKIEFVDVEQENDTIICAGDAKIFIDAKSAPYLSGMEIDYVREGLGEGFKFNNPNVKDKCGCGESFRV